MARRNFRYSVRPRFGPGSPAMVRPEIAESVAADEREFHEHALAGRYGEEAQARAQDEHALYGIAYVLTEYAKHWHYFDLITEEERDISFGQWRLEDALIRKGHAPSEARHVAEEIAKQVKRLDAGRAFHFFEAFEENLALYENSAYEYPRERAIRDSIFHAVRS